MNRQTKRMMQRQGTDRPRPPERRERKPAATAPVKRERTTPAQFMGEVRGELRKVVWPTKQEVVNSSIIVVLAVAFLTGLIFLLDYSSAKFVLFLFD